MSELRSGSELIGQAEVAEERGLAFVSISHHLHPWRPEHEHEHSPFRWSVFGCLAAAAPRDFGHSAPPCAPKPLTSVPSLPMPRLG